MIIQAHKNTDAQVVERWLLSGKIAHISGLDLKPVPHPLLLESPQCIIKGQGCIFFLRQYPQKNIWLLKKFASSRRPSREYLRAVTDYLPGMAEFFTCTQRRVLTARHIDLRKSTYKNAWLRNWIEDTVLMPKVPGQPWSSMADQIREGTRELSILDRLRMSLSLAECVDRLEACGCSHRDLSCGNVFVSQDSYVYLIDWDCLYNRQLPFQANTTAGTMGYMPSFIKISSGNWDASRSWRRCADRFALSILITEFLLLNNDTSMPQEDGSFFSQAQLDEPDKQFVSEQVIKLCKLSRKCASLLKVTLNASSFEECPSPAQWRDILRYSLRRERVQKQTDPAQRPFRRHLKHICAECSEPCWLDEARSIELKSRGKPVLCKSCLDSQLENQSAARQKRDIRYPEIACEHCGDIFRVRREKLNKLRSQAKVILCHSCLQQQMHLWKMEQTETKP
jgi:serine/threonine protein kinase